MCAPHFTSHHLLTQVRRHHRFLAAVERTEAYRTQLEGLQVKSLAARVGAHCITQVYIGRVDPDGVSAMVRQQCGVVLLNSLPWKLTISSGH